MKFKVVLLPFLDRNRNFGKDRQTNSLEGTGRRSTALKDLCPRGLSATLQGSATAQRNSCVHLAMAVEHLKWRSGEGGTEFSLFTHLNVSINSPVWLAVI